MFRQSPPQVGCQTRVELTIGFAEKNIHIFHCLIPARPVRGDKPLMGSSKKFRPRFAGNLTILVAGFFPYCLPL